YEITGVRDAVHDCVLNEDKVRVVEVEKKPILSTIPKKSAMEGSVITFAQSECERLGCEYWAYCHPIGIKDGDRLKVEYVMDDVNCPMGNEIILSKLF
ncbi:MAG: UPF0179 family protein, partial [archaeon]|nr:UPF0179 family protein [archaeon]